MKPFQRMLAVGGGAFSMMCAFLTTACATGGDSGKLVVWTFSDDTEAMVEMYEQAIGEDVIDVHTYPQDVFQTRLDGVLRTGTNAPDVVALEISFVKKYVEGGKLMSLDELGISERAKQELYGYTNEVGTASDGTMYAVSNQAAPGGFFYRRSMAEELWGDSSPEFVQQKLSSWDNFLAVAAELKEHGKKIVSNLNASEKVFLCERENGWVVDNTLQVDSCWDTYLNQIRTIQENGYCNETVEYGAGGGWYTDISGNEVFGYFLGAWGLNYHLKANAKGENGDSTNDWGVVQGPSPYYSGGTWFAGIGSSSKKDQIKSLLEYWMFDQDFLKAWAERTQDFVGNKITVEAIKGSFADPFLQGQNHYALFAEIAESITAKNVTLYDAAIGSLFSAAAVDYAMGKTGTIADAYNQFRTNVSYAYSNIDVGL